MSQNDSYFLRGVGLEREVEERAKKKRPQKEHPIKNDF